MSRNRDPLAGARREMKRQGRRRVRDRDRAYDANERAANNSDNETPAVRSWEEQDRTDTHVTKVNAGYSRDNKVNTTEFLVTPLNGSTGDHVVRSAEDGSELYHGDHHNP